MHSFYKNKKPGKQRVFERKRMLKKGSGGVGGPRRRKTLFPVLTIRKPLTYYGHVYKVCALCPPQNPYTEYFPDLPEHPRECSLLLIQEPKEILVGGSHRNEDFVFGKNEFARTQ
jgi:hypothetical protein